jgi:hypothetical protein
MYRAFLTLEGTIEDVNELNESIEKETGIIDFFDTESENWRAWVEYKDGKTEILEEVAKW